MKGKQLLLIAGISLGLATSGAAYAQSSHNSGEPAHKPAAASQASKASFSQSELKEFAAVQKDLRQIRVKYRPKIKAAKSKKDARSVQMKAEKEMVTAIKKKGLSVAEYNKIARAYQSNANVRKKINTLVKNS